VTSLDFVLPPPSRGPLTRVFPIGVAVFTFSHILKFIVSSFFRIINGFPLDYFLMIVCLSFWLRFHVYSANATFHHLCFQSLFYNQFPDWIGVVHHMIKATSPFSLSRDYLVPLGSEEDLNRRLHFGNPPSPSPLPSRRFLLSENFSSREYSFLPLRISSHPP